MRLLDQLLVVGDGGVDHLLALPVRPLIPAAEHPYSDDQAILLKPESTEGRPWGQPLKKLEGAPVNLG